jgi:benzoate transporter
LHPSIAGVVAAITGFASSFAIVLTGVSAVGATTTQAASGLLVICLTQGVMSIAVSWRYRMPVVFAWSTPGGAVLAGAGVVTHHFAEAVGAFIVASGLILLTGLWSALGRLIARIPKTLANAMLAGILLPICLTPITAAVREPWLAIPVIVLWLVLLRIAPRWAVPAAIVLTALLLAVTTQGGWSSGVSLLPQFAFVAPQFSVPVLIGIAVPLYIVTMAGQNIPGIAILHSFDYDVPVRPALVGTGALSALGALFGGIPINLAAITQAMTAGPDASADRDRRWIAPIAAGATYIGQGVAAGLATAFVSAAPPILIEAVAGLALTGALIGAIVGAIAVPEQRIPAVLTLLLTASGIAVLGVGSAFWGLVIGGIAFALLCWHPRAVQRARRSDVAPDRTPARWDAVPAARAQAATPERPRESP